MELDVYQVDAFTKELFSGNPAGVILNADGLDEKTMIAIARELNNSESAFVFAKKGSGYDIQVRFFTPTREVPICGHATISAHYVYSRKLGLRNCRILQKAKAGILPVEVVDSASGTRVVMTQGGIEFGAILCEAQRRRLIDGLGIMESDLDGSLPIQIVSTGHSKVMVPIFSKACLDSLKPRNDVLNDLSEDIRCNGFYAFTFDSQEKDILTSGRMFAPAIGINEDPVTGNANGPLGAYLTKYEKIDAREDGYSFIAKQGEAIGRKGYVGVQVLSRKGEPEVVKISGEAVIAFHTTIRL
jgi:phenazine biosynthesis protein PhzF family